MKKGDKKHEKKIKGKEMVKEPKYYYYHSSKKKWIVSRIINGSKKFLGEYKTEKEAQLAVKLYHKYGWDPKNNWKIRAEVKMSLKKEENTDGSS